jgi:predicted naringenin-chalcone synthase
VRGLTGVLLCVELVSLHLQPALDDTEQILSHSLFSDAAVAVVCRPGAPGLRLVDVASVTDTNHADKMSWDITDLGFRMGLSSRVPDVLAGQVGDFVDSLLGKHDLRRDDIRGWAVHPGGPRILDVVEDRLDLPGDALQPSRDVLRDYGNCSSGTVLLVLDEIVRRTPLRDGDHALAMAFGPGLTLYAALLRQES